MIRRWCPGCRAMRVVEDTSIEGEQTRYGEVTYAVTWLDCGHTVQGEGQVDAEAPGAPYVGAGVVVAPTARLRDRIAAQARQSRVEADYAQVPA